MIDTDRLRTSSLLTVTVATLLLSVVLPTRDRARATEPVAPVTGAWLGVSSERLDDAWRERENYWSNGVLVSAVAPGSPAERIGLKPGDVLVSVGSQILKTPQDLSRSERELTPGESVSLVVARNGGRWIRILNVAAAGVPGAERASAADEAAEPAADERRGTATEDAAAVSAEGEDEGAETEAGDVPVPPVSGAPRTELFGVRTQPMNPGLAAALGVADPRGLLVLDVTPGGVADAAGIRAGDVITRVGDLEVMDADKLSHALETCPRLTAVRTWRQGTVREARVTFPTRRAMLAALKAKAAPASAAPLAEAAKAPDAAPGAEPPKADQAAAEGDGTPGKTGGDAAPEEAKVETPQKVETPEVAARPEGGEGTEGAAPPAVETPRGEALPLVPAKDLERMIRDMRLELNELRQQIRRLRAELHEIKQI